MLDGVNLLVGLHVLSCKSQQVKSVNKTPRKQLTTRSRLVAIGRAYHRKVSSRNSSIGTQNKCRLPSLSERLVKCELSVESLSSSVSLWPLAITSPPPPTSSWPSSSLLSSAAAFGIEELASVASLEPLAAAVCVIYKQRQYTNTER